MSTKRERAMNDFAVLGYLEARRLRNFAIASLRQPSRLVVWIMAIVLIAFLSYTRALRTGTTTGHFGLHEPFAGIVGFGALTALGVIVGSGAGGAVGTFYNAADARFLAMSALRERSVVMWLQLRNSLLTLLRMGFALLMYAFFFARGNSSGAFLGMTGGIVLATMLPLPAFEIARHVGKEPVRAFGYGVAAVAFVCAALTGLSLAFPQMHGTAQLLRHAGVGHAAAALWSGNPIAVCALYGAALLLLLCGVMAASDVYPELYTAALRYGGGTRRRWLALHRPQKGQERAQSSETRASGVWTYFWKERITLARGPALRTMFFVELSIALIGGTIAGIAGKRTPEILGGLAGSIGASLIILLAASGTSLARDVSKPLWWMGAGTTLQKVAAWCWATSLDTTIVFTAGLVAMAFGSGSYWLMYAGIPASVVLPPLIRAVGVVTYTFFPSAIDQRGPIAALRIFVIYGCLIPPIAAGIVCGIALRSAIAGWTATCGVLIFEGIACMAIAARKLEGRGAEYAVAEAQ